MSAAQRLKFYLNISNDEFLAYYQGHANSVLVRSEDGRNVQLPAQNLRQFLTGDGIRGVFEMELDDTNKLLELRLIG